MISAQMVQDAGEDPPPSQEGQNPFNKYMYPEFAGFAGERLLKSLLRKIITRAHLHAWEIFAEAQAPGNDCFLSMASAAKALERMERTVRESVLGLQARKLLVLRVGKKLLRQADGTHRKKLVVVKDFSGLYALAHEYWLWTQNDEYIEPSREFAEVLQQLDDEQLKKKLLRYENYRRIIQDQIPGRKPRQCEVHPLFADFDPSLNEQSQQPSQLPVEEDAKDAKEEEKGQVLSLITQINSSINPQIIAEERIKGIDQSNLQRGDSNDSEDYFEGEAEDYTKSEIRLKTEQVRGTTPPNPNPKTTKSSFPTVTETRGANQSAGREQAPGSQQNATGSSSKSGRKKYQGDGKPRPAANPLISAYVGEFARVLGDLNPRGSETYLLRLAEQAGLSGSGVLVCLLRAHVEAISLTAHDHHPITGQPLKMKIVNMFFRDFSATYAEWGAGYPCWQRDEDLEKDERFRQFHAECQDKLERESVEVVEAQVLESPQMLETGEEDQEQGEVSWQLVEDLGIAAPASWMKPVEAEALLKTIQEKIPLLEGVRLVDAVIYHRCRSLLRAGSGSVVHLEAEFVNGVGITFSFPLDFADEEQWKEYYDVQQRGLPARRER